MKYFFARQSLSLHLFLVLETQKILLLVKKSMPFDNKQRVCGWTNYKECSKTNSGELKGKLLQEKVLLTSDKFQIHYV